MELGKRVQVGPSAIQPIRGVGEGALVGLNTWLKEHGFPTEVPQHMKYFVEHGFTFLCVRVQAKGGDKAVPVGGDLPPLHLSFATKKPYYPLKFSSMQGVFDVSLHVLTRERLSYEKSASVLQRMGWSNEEYKRNYVLSRFDPLALLKEQLRKGRKQVESGWFYNHIQCSDVNEGMAISKWQEDIFFELGKQRGYGVQRR